MTKKNPDERYTVDQCLAHDWFKMETATKAEVKSHYYKTMGKNVPIEISCEDRKRLNEQMLRLRLRSYKNIQLRRKLPSYKGASEAEANQWAATL